MHSLFDIQFVIKVEGMLSKDIPGLNSKIRHLLQCNRRNNPVLVDLTFDRISQLGKLQDSVLEDSRVHPCVQYVPSLLSFPSFVVVVVVVADHVHLPRTLHKESISKKARRERVSKSSV